MTSTTIEVKTSGCQTISEIAEESGPTAAYQADLTASSYEFTEAKSSPQYVIPALRNE
jgi:hypothetical protein